MINVLNLLTIYQQLKSAPNGIIHRIQIRWVWWPVWPDFSAEGKRWKAYTPKGCILGVKHPKPTKNCWLQKFINLFCSTYTNLLKSTVQYTFKIWAKMEEILPENWRMLGRLELTSKHLALKFCLGCSYRFVLCPSCPIVRNFGARVAASSIAPAPMLAWSNGVHCRWYFVKISVYTAK